MDLARQGMIKVTIYQDRRKLKYQDGLLKAQEEAKKQQKKAEPIIFSLIAGAGHWQ